MPIASMALDMVLGLHAAARPAPARLAFDLLNARLVELAGWCLPTASKMRHRGPRAGPNAGGSSRRHEDTRCLRRASANEAAGMFCRSRRWPEYRLVHAAQTNSMSRRSPRG